jgi:hypothetical protein
LELSYIDRRLSTGFSGAGKKGRPASTTTFIGKGNRNIKQESTQCRRPKKRAFRAKNQ